MRYLFHSILMGIVIFRLLAGAGGGIPDSVQVKFRKGIPARHRIPLEVVLHRLETVYSIHFVYEDLLVQGKYCLPPSHLSGDFSRDVQQILAPLGIQYMKVGTKTYVLFRKKTVLSPRRVIQGKVLDTEGQPIPDAEVLIQGTPWGAAADDNGFYQIRNVPEGRYTLVARCMGFRPAYRDIVVTENAHLRINFILEVDVLNMEEVVTIASRNPLTKIQSSVAITTANSRQITELAPRSTAELLKIIPGFYVESSGGVSSNNLFPRGIPQDGGYRYVAMFEDGLPIFEAPELSFANIDIFFRVDQTLSQMEGMRGGTSCIYASNAPGGLINFISKTGTNELQMLTRISVGDHGYYRLDYNFSGPFLNRFRFNIGGFMRYDNGIRSPGFPANRGGQIKGNISWLFRRGYIRLYAKYLNDRNVFYLPIPLQNPESPQSLPGFDAHYGTMTTVHGQHVAFPRPDGKTIQRDLSDGIHPNARSLMLEVALDAGKGWTIKNLTRWMAADLQYNAIFSLDNPFAARDFALKIKRLDTIPDFDHYAYYYVGEDEPIRDVDRLNGNGLVARNGWWAVDKPLFSVTNQLLLKKKWRGHTWSAGLYFSHYGAKDFWYWHNILTEVKSAPRLLNLYAMDKNNRILAAVTTNGFEQYGSFYVNAKHRANLAAFSLVEEWQANPALRLDAGLRLEYEWFHGLVEETRRDFTVGSGKSWAEHNVMFGTGTFRRYRYRFREWAFSVGANYNFTAHLAVFGRGGRGFRTPDFDHWLFSASRGNSQYVLQLEGGVKFSSEKLAFFNTLFFSRLNHIPFVDEMVVNGRIVKKGRYASSTTMGSEWEFILLPTRWFQVQFIGTLQDPRFRNFIPHTIDPESGEPVVINLSGKRVRRIPSILSDLRLTLDHWGFRVVGEWQYVGERFVDDANTATLPAFHLFNAGLFYTIPGRDFQLGLHVFNLTNAIGLTEGNPRVEQVFASRENKIFMARPVLGRTIRVSAQYRF